MNPEQPFQPPTPPRPQQPPDQAQPPAAGQPLFHGPFQPPGPAPQQPVVSQPQPVVSPSGGRAAPKPRNKMPIIAGAVGGLTVLVLIIVAVAAMSGGQKAPQTNQDANSSQQSSGPEAATSNSIQQINDSISQDISGLNDDKDLPADKFSDQNLGL